MSIIFKPAISLMNKLKYSKKLILLAGISFLVIFILTFQLVRQSLAIMDFSHRELLGVEYINPLISTMKNLQQYRMLQNDLIIGHKVSLSTLDSAREDIDRSMSNVEEKEQSLGKTLKTTGSWNDIKAKWQLVKNDTQKSQSGLVYDDLSLIIANVQRLIITACDTSNLTLDPDIDTYYLMDTYCTKLPNFNEEIPLIYDVANRGAANKALSPAEREQLVINKTLLEQFNKEGINGNFEKVLAERSSLLTEMDPLLQTFTANTDSFTRLIDSTTLANNFTATVADYKEKAAPLVNISYKLYTVTGDKLYQLIQERVDKISAALYRNIVLAVVGLVVLIYLFSGIYFSVITSIRSLVRGSEKLAEGDLTAKVELETHDELVQVATSFNIMRDSLSKIIAELHEVVNSELQGDLAKRIVLEDKTGFSRDLSAAINQVSDNFQSIINETSQVLDNLSQGNLSSRITKNFSGAFGDLSNYVNSHVETLIKLIGDIKDSSQAINKAAQDIAMGNNDLAKRTEQQSAFLEETAASIEEVTATVKQNAENAKQANELAQSASDVATKGGVVVNDVVKTMTDINDSSRKVADIISVIEDIAFQTNILALNAAVEAARAGEQGRGFAVVANEVRNLAQRTSVAAKESKSLISASVEKVDGGTKLVDQAGHTMGEIVKAVNRVTEIMSEIASASIEQRSGIEQVNQAIVQMDQVTQKNSTLVEDAAKASKSLETQTIHMDNLVGFFKLEQTTSGSKIENHVSILNNSHSLKTDVKKNVVSNKNKPLETKNNKGIWEEF